MTREEAKELLPIIQAFADGRTIEFLNNDDIWEECEEPLFCSVPKRYRIKPESKYRPFNTAEECCNELQKHTPYGILKKKEGNRTFKICGIYTNIWNGQLKIEFSDISGFETAVCAYHLYEFEDGTPFGMKEGIDMKCQNT